MIGAMRVQTRKRAPISAPTVTRATASRVDTGYINSTGIALIVRLLADARRDHRDVRAAGLSPHYVEIFRITRLSDYVRILDGPAGAGAAAPGAAGTASAAGTAG